MSDKKYPYIGKATHGTVIVFTAPKVGFCISSAIGSNGRYVGGRVEHLFTNITRECLANTYGEVKNERHAEFIKVMAEVNSIGCSHKKVDDGCKYFYVFDGVLFFCHKEIAVVGEFKKIKIPEPPEGWNMSHYEEQAEEFEMKQRDMAANVSKEPDFFIPSEDPNNDPAIGYYTPAGDLVVETGTPSSAGASFTELDTLNIAHEPEPGSEGSSFEKENGDNLHFGGEDKCKEWPCVGDEVLLSDKLNSYDLKGFTGKVCKVIGTCLDGENKVLTIKSGNHISSLYDGGWVEKPKTPEEDLRDDIAEQLASITDNVLRANGKLLRGIAKAMVQNKIPGLEITKKPQ